MSLNHFGWQENAGKKMDYATDFGVMHTVCTSLKKVKLLWMFTTNFRLLLKVWLTLKCLLLLKYMCTFSPLGIIVRAVAVSVIHTSINVFFLSLWKSVTINPGLLWVFSSAHDLFITTEKRGFLTITDDTGITLKFKTSHAKLSIWERNF